MLKQQKIQFNAINAITDTRKSCYKLVLLKFDTISSTQNLPDHRTHQARHRSILPTQRIRPIKLYHTTMPLCVLLLARRYINPWRAHLKTRLKNTFWEKVLKRFLHSFGFSLDFNCLNLEFTTTMPFTHFFCSYQKRCSILRYYFRFGTLKSSGLKGWRHWINGLWNYHQLP